jgi:hypothetical protein
VAARRGTLARTPLQISETVPDPVFYLVRHSRSPDYARGSTPAATAKDIERAGVRTHRYGYPHRNTERNSAAEQHFCDHQMPSHWSRCMLRIQCSLRRASRSSCHLSHRSMNRLTILSIAIISQPVGYYCCGEPGHWVWAGDRRCGVRHVLIVARRRGLVAHASAKPGYLLPATCGRYPLPAGR